MAAVQCDNFVGNAWKKDLCLNCFKSKEEHVSKNGYLHRVPTRIPDPPKEGILKGKKSASQPSKGNKVIFLNTEYEVIGFGGDDVYSDDEDYPDIISNSQTEEDDQVDSEEDKAFQKLTKTNTDYNSIPENLQEPKEGEVKKVVEPLKLGKQVFDDKGNKKTLLVSVTPFGGQTEVKNKLNVNGFKMNGTSENKTYQSDSERVEKQESDQKDLVVLSKTKETDEKVKTGVNVDAVKESSNSMNSEVSKKGGKLVNSLDLGQTCNEDSLVKLTNDKSIKRSQPLDKNFKFRLNKDLQKENQKNTELNGKDESISIIEKTKSSEELSNGTEISNQRINSVGTENQNFKVIAKDFINAIEKKSIENNNKGVVLDIYKIRDKGDVKTKNEINEDKTIRSLLVSSEINGKLNASDAKISTSVVDSSKNIKTTLRNGTDSENKRKEITKDKSENIPNGSCIDRNKLVPNVSSLYRHHFKNQLIKNVSEKENSESTVKPLLNGVITSKSQMSNIECTFLKNDKAAVEPSGESNVESTVEAQEDIAAETESEKFKKSSFDSYENFEKIIKGEEITLFSAVDNAPNGSEKENVEQEKDVIGPEISRESAGEPDGRADSDDLSEPPALPLKPPPPLTDSRTTFLHDLTTGSDGIKIVSEKPKVPAKPIIIQSKKINFQSPIHSSEPKTLSMELQKVLEVASPSEIKPHAPLQESLSSDSSKNQKRPAPKPPSPKEDSCDRVVTVLTEVSSDESGSKQPEVVEEPIVKRISRSTENLLEFITGQEDKAHLATEGLEEIKVEEPVPRRSLSLSQDSLVPGEVGDAQFKKKPSRGRFLLRKLLHLGKPKETTKDLTVGQKVSLTPTPKPKLEIIHPSDLNGSGVEVVPPVRTSKSRRTSSSASSSSSEQRESDVLSDSSTSHSVSSSGNDSQNTIDKLKRPPPPPRGNSLDTWCTKPARPPPPKSIDVLRQSNSSWTTSVESKSDNLYVNLGEARSGLAPNKPVRTGSLRETNMDSSKRFVAVVTQPEDSDYESFVAAPVQYSTPSHESDDNLYECVQVSNHISSLPECDSTLTDSPNSTYAKGKRSLNNRSNNHRRSEGNVDVASDFFKMKFMRSVSLPYCASETESEIYSPYSFYGSELGEDDFESSSSSHALRMSRLKLKKGRSIVHKNLEDNYGAVIVANHEALAQVVEQMRQGPIVPPALRALSTAVNLRWTDFTIAKDSVGVVVERRVFYPALWGSHAVTLSIMVEQGINSSFHPKGPFNLNPLTELNDLIPASYLPMLKKDKTELIQASISVFSRLQVETIESYGKSMNAGFLSDESKKEVNFVLLQIINAFKSLQAQGIEEAPENLTNLVVCREEKDPHPRICITHSFERSQDGTSRSSLCQCLMHAIKDILPPTDLTPLISNVLRKEKAVSLSQAKGVLEFTLWGPSDIAFRNSTGERESALQRWLDLERATVLHGLVRTRAELTVFEEWQLLFLVRTNAKMMVEASFLLESVINEDVSTA